MGIVTKDEDEKHEEDNDDEDKLDPVLVWIWDDFDIFRQSGLQTCEV